MENKIRWGVLSTAKIGLTQVIPAMQQGRFTVVTAIASGNGEKVKKAAADLGIAKVYFTYEALLADEDIDAVYIPLPNHLHVAYAIKAMQAGRHVLCEKPVGMDAAGVKQLINAAAQHPHLKVMEAFMYRFHPQWKKVKQLVDGGELGRVKHVHAAFSYYNTDAANIRNKPETGGGALMDIGCYCISFPRFIFGRGPERVTALINIDPQFKTDNLTSGLLDFGDGLSATFTCSTRLEPCQRVNIMGEKGRLEVEVPVNAPAGQPCRLWLQQEKNIQEITIAPANQYTLQADEFSKAILYNTPVPTPLTDALGNMQVIDALFASARQHGWVTVGA